MDIASEHIQKDLSSTVESREWKPDFKDVWNAIGTDNIAVLAIENSYMGSIHPNMYGFLRHDCKIIGVYDMPIHHCLCSKETDISDITQAYSQVPALDQCYHYLKDKGIEPVAYSDTSLAARHVSEIDEPWSAAICSELAAHINGLNILDTHIEDQESNTTRFAVVVPNDLDIEYRQKIGRVTILFHTDHTAGSLYRCLGVLANRGINMTKIESIPMGQWHFSYGFWITFEWFLTDDAIQKALQELEPLTEKLRIIGQY